MINHKSRRRFGRIAAAPEETRTDLFLLILLIALPASAFEETCKNPTKGIAEPVLIMLNPCTSTSPLSASVQTSTTPFSPTKFFALLLFHFFLFS